MTKAQLLLKKIIQSLNRDQLNQLLAAYGYPRQEITPELLETIFEREGEPFAKALAKLVKKTMTLNRATGPAWEAKDVNQAITTGSGLLTAIFKSLDLGGTAKSEAEVARWKAEAEASKASANPWPWIIGGVVVVTLIVVLVTNRK